MRPIILGLFGALAAPAAAEEVTSFDLENGMQVVVIEDHRAPVAVHMVWYPAGAADEPPGASGVAHFLEHLMFKATETSPSGAFSTYVAAIGGSDNAFTSSDYTAYFQRVAAEHLPRMMEMEADRMQNLALTPEDIATERQVILEERSQRTDNNAGALAREQAMAALYLNHRYGVPIIGWRHEMETLDLADARAWYERHYAPDEAILIVAGDVEPDAVRALAEEYYGAIPSSGAPPARLRAEEPPQLAERRLVYADPRVGQPYVARSYLAPERDAGDQREAAALVYLAQLMGGSSFTSLMARALTFDEEIAVFSGASYDALSLDDTTFTLTVAPLEGVTLAEAEAAMDGVIAALLAEGIDPEQFARIKTQLSAAEIYGRDDVQGLAQLYGAALTSGLTVEDVRDWPGILQSVTAEEVMAAAERLFDIRRSVTQYVVRTREEALQ